MPENKEIIPHSRCDGCPCECHTKSYNLIVLECGKRLEHETSKKEE